MELNHIDIANLSVSSANMRVKGRAAVVPAIGLHGNRRVATVTRVTSEAVLSPSTTDPLAEAA